MNKSNFSHPFIISTLYRSHSLNLIKVNIHFFACSTACDWLLRIISCEFYPWCINSWLKSVPFIWFRLTLRQVVFFPILCRWVKVYNIPILILFPRKFSQLFFARQWVILLSYNFLSVLFRLPPSHFVRLLIFIDHFRHIAEVIDRLPSFLLKAFPFNEVFGPPLQIDAFVEDRLNNEHHFHLFLTIHHYQKDIVRAYLPFFIWKWRKNNHQLSLHLTIWWFMSL